MFIEPDGKAHVFAVMNGRNRSKGALAIGKGFRTLGTRFEFFSRPHPATDLIDDLNEGIVPKIE